MRCDRLRTALLGGLLLLVAGVPAQAHRGSVCREVLGGEYLACADLQAEARAEVLAAASTEQLEERQRQAAKEEAAAAFGAGLRAALDAALVATDGDRFDGFELFGLMRGRALEAARAQAAASPLTASPAPLPRRSPVLVHQALARATLEPASALPRVSEPASARLELARFLKTRVRAFNLGPGEQHQGNQRFRLGIASDLFHGLWTDPVSGFGYARARWLDHRNASWLSEDPAGTVDSTNLYAYVAWAPQAVTDPLGLQVADSELADIYDRIGKAADEAARTHGVTNWTDELTAGKEKATKIHSEMQRLLAPGGKYHHPRILTEVAVAEGGTIVDFGRPSRPAGALVKDLVILRPGHTIDDVGRFVTKAPDVTLGVVDLKVGLFGAAMRQGDTLKRFGVTNLRLKLFRKLDETQVVSGLRWAKKVRGLPVLSGIALGLTLSEAKAAADSGDLNRAMLVMSGLDIWQDAAHYAAEETERRAKEYLDSVGASGEVRTQQVRDIEREE